jgi:hypothetical protein
MRVPGEKLTSPNTTVGAEAKPCDTATLSSTHPVLANESTIT